MTTILRNVDSAIEAFADDEMLAFDLETNAFTPWDGEIAVVTLANRTTAAVLHVLGEVPPKLWRFLESRKRLVGHNVVNFDAVWSLEYGMDIDKVEWYDTMVGEQAILPAGRKDFRANLSTTLERRFRTNKDARKRDMGEHRWMEPVLTAQQVEYAAHDVLHLLALRDIQMGRGEGNSLGGAIDLEMRLVPILARMKWNGLPVSLDAMTTIIKEKMTRANALRIEIFEAFGRDINMRSPKQLMAACREIGLMIPNTTWETFRNLELAHMGAETIAGKIIEYKANDQLLKMYSQKWVDSHYKDDNRVHSSFWQLGTDTGRFCISATALVDAPRDMNKYPKGIPITEIEVGQLVYSLTEKQRLCLSPVAWVGKTGMRHTITITAVDKDRDVVQLRLTPEHQVRMVDNSWKKAGDLVVGDNVCCMVKRRPTWRQNPYYRFLTASVDYPVKAVGSNNVDEHRWVYGQVHGVGSLDPEKDVHHIDGSAQNNHPDNLELVPHKRHSTVHKNLHSDRELLQMYHGEILSTYKNRKALMKALYIRNLVPKPPGPPTDAELIQMYNKEIPNRYQRWSTLVHMIARRGLTTSNHTITSITQNPEIEDVWDLEVKYTHTFFADGIAVHNSSSEPNLQQVPKNARLVYVAPKGWKMVSCDYSQIEVRIAAAQAHDQVLLTSMETDDVHTAIAAQMFSTPVDQITKAQRSLAKACVFTLLFAGSAERLYEYTRLNGGDLSLQDSKILFARFFNTYKGLQEARTKAQYLSRNRVVPITLPTGIKRILTSGLSLTPQTILNTTVQGTAAAGLKYALLECQKAGLHKYIGATVHDEIVACVPEAMAEAFGDSLKAAMLKGMAEVTDAPLRAEVRVDDMWG